MHTNLTSTTEQFEPLLLPLAERLRRHAEKQKQQRKATSRKRGAPEKEIVDAVCKSLIQQGWLVIQMQSGVMARYHDGAPFAAYRIRNTAASSGLSDLVAYKGGHALFIEVKSDKGRQTTKQRQFQRLCEAHGMRYVIVRSVEDMHTVMRTVGEQAETTLI